MKPALPSYLPNRRGPEEGSVRHDRLPDPGDQRRVRSANRKDSSDAAGTGEFQERRAAREVAFNSRQPGLHSKGVYRELGRVHQCE